MKNLKFLMPCLFLLSINLFILTSCEKEGFLEEINIKNMTLETPEVQAELSLEVEVQNGMLAFESIHSYRNSLAALQEMDVESIEEWGKSMNFTSLFSFFQNLVEKEWVNQGTEHSTAYIQAIQKGIIKEASQSFELNLFNPAYSHVLNVDGLVKIGEDIYQMTADQLKIWKNGNSQNPAYLINASRSGDDISIVPVESTKLNALSKSVSWNDGCKSESRSSTLLVEVKYNSFYKDRISKNVLFIDYSVFARCIVSTNKGWTIDPKAYVELNGISEIEISITDGVNIHTSSQTRKSFVTSRNGSILFTPELAGTYYVKDRVFFAKAAKLKYAEWNALSISSKRDVHECSVFKATEVF